MPGSNRGLDGSNRTRRSVIATGASLGSLALLGAPARGRAKSTLSRGLRELSEEHGGVLRTQLQETGAEDIVLYKFRFGDGSTRVLRGRRVGKRHFRFSLAGAKYETRVTRADLDTLDRRMAKLREEIERIPFGGEE